MPIELTRFIGRESELEDLRTRLDEGRLLTLTGAGGSGKTRLAFELLRRIEADGPDIAIAELAGLADPALLPRHIAEAFDIHEEVQGDAPGALVELLRNREALLVLDNCEHVVEACAHLVETILRGCPGIRILATSREALGVPGERAWLVPALSLPRADDDVAEIGRSEAVRLFVDRARDVAPDFALTPQNAPAVAEICVRLDGIPLAIELAAARVKVLAPEQIRDRLDDAFALLRSGSRTAIPRHRTLRAAIDWSHALLDDDSRVLFRRLAVFRGGFTLDAAEAVGGGDGLDPAIVLDLVERLVDRSLIAVREIDGEARYSLLETVRQYAAAELAARGNEAATRERHAHHVEQTVARAEPHFTRTERRTWFERLLPEMENIREALHWTRAYDHALHVRLVGRLWWFWYSTRFWAEAQRWIEGALALPAAAPPAHDRAAVLYAAGALACLQTRVGPAKAWLEESAAIAAATGDARLEAYALNYLGMAYSQTGDPQGPPYSARAEAWFREHGDLYGLRLALLIQGTGALAAGLVERAEACNLEGIEVARRFGQDRELAIALGNTASVYLERGEFARAEGLLREALYALRRDPSYLFIARTLDLYGEVLGGLGHALNAARVMSAADSIRAAVGARGFKLDMDRRERLLPGIRAAAGEEAFRAAWASGVSLAPDAILGELLDGVPADGERRRADRRARPRLPAAPAPLSAPAPVPSAEPVAVALDVRALGPLVVHIEGEPLDPDAWSYAKPKELLLQLLLHEGGRTRDQIGAALWPQATPAQAKNSFHVTLHHLRKALGHPEWIVVQGDRYRLAPDVGASFDADRFETAARAALRDDAASIDDVRGILALDRGDLFAGENVDWIEEHRSRLRRLGTDLRLRLGRALEDADRTGEAMEVYRAVTRRDDLDEEAHRRLMICHARSGARAEALRHYGRLAKLLREVLDADPEPETVELYERIRTAGPV